MIREFSPRLGLSTLAFLLLSGLAIAMLGFASTRPALLWLAVLLPPVLTVAAVLLVSACRGRPWALACYLSLLVILPNISFRVRESGAIDLDWQSGLKLVLWLGALSIAVARLGSIKNMLLSPPTLYMLIYCILAVFSLIYSPVPIYTLGSALGLMAYMLFGLATAMAMPDRLRVMTLLISLCLLLVASWVALLVAPDLARLPDDPVRLSGVTSHPNQLGTVAALFVVLGVVAWREGYLGVSSVVGLLVLGFATLIATDSRGSLAAAVCAAAFILIRRSGRVVAVCLLAATLGAMILLASTSSRVLQNIVPGLTRTGDATELTTLTGRTELWTFAWEKFLESPILGYGFNATEPLIVKGFQATNGWLPKHTHNMFLQTLLTGGLVGFGFLMLYLIRIAAAHFVEPYALRDSMLVLIVVTGLIEPSAFGSTPSVLTLAFLMSVVSGAKAGAANNLRGASSDQRYASAFAAGHARGHLLDVSKS